MSFADPFLQSHTIEERAPSRTGRVEALRSRARSRASSTDSLNDAAAADAPQSSVTVRATGWVTDESAYAVSIGCTRWGQYIPQIGDGLLLGADCSRFSSVSRITAVTAAYS